jgi:hypothetical protein
MKRITTRGVVVGVSMLMVAVLSVLIPHTTHATESQGEGVRHSAHTIQDTGVIASGAAEDTLKTCLARIPRVASTGQRMLAEQSCAGEETARNAIQSAPKF